MSRKSELTEILRHARIEIDSLSQSIQKIDQNESLSDTGKSMAIQQTRAKSEHQLATYRQQAQDILNRASGKVSRRPDTMQPIYQTALSNALQSILLAGDKMSASTLQNLCRPFSGDTAAEAALQAAFSKSGGKAVKPWNKNSSEGNGAGRVGIDLFPESTQAKQTLKRIGFAQTLCNDLTAELPASNTGGKPWNQFRSTSGHMTADVDTTFQGLQRHLDALNDDLSGQSVSDEE